MGQGWRSCRKELVAAKMDADGLRAQMSAMRTHSRALEAQLLSARVGTSLQDIQAVAGKDKRLVRDHSPDDGLLQACRNPDAGVE